MHICTYAHLVLLLCKHTTNCYSSSLCFASTYTFTSPHVIIVLMFVIFYTIVFLYIVYIFLLHVLSAFMLTSAFLSSTYSSLHLLLITDTTTYPLSISRLCLRFSHSRLRFYPVRTRAVRRAGGTHWQTPHSPRTSRPCSVCGMGV
jgi:hypothetical protein